VLEFGFELWDYILLHFIVEGANAMYGRFMV
jgi:hypothetical protein